MPRRSLIAVTGFLLFSVIGLRPPGSSGTDPARASRSPVSPFSEAALLAVERENGCTGEEPSTMQGAWPDWKSATIAGGDVPPTRVVSDPYPTLHSVAVDAEHDRVFMSDPNRHALWSYDRLAASTG